jgi:glycosyltransferase involved in cell wall biosynthesis
MRIAIFSEVYAPMVSGVALTLKRTADALRARGHPVRVYSATYPALPGQAVDEDLHQSPSTPFPLSPQVQWAWPNRTEITADLRAFRPDVVHLATEFAMGRAGLAAARHLGIPIIASAHTDYERYASRYGLAWSLPMGWSYLRRFYGHAQAVLAPSASYAAHLQRRGVPHTAIWSRGVDPERFSPAHRSGSYRASLGLPDDALVAAYVGRLAPEKGLGRLLDSWPTIAALHPRAHLVFTGDGQMEDAIRDRRLPRVHLDGARSGTALSEAYASADLFVMPSETETFGNVTLEAMASGLPVLAVAAGGVLEFGRHDENALLVDPACPTGWVTALDRLLADPALRRRLSGGARQAALGRAWGPVFDGLLSHYAIAAGLRHHPAGHAAQAA